MLKVKDIIISESAPNDPKVGWVTTVNGKPTLRFNINGIWKDMIEKPDNPEEDIDSYYRILVGPDGGLWLLSIYGDADLNNDDQIIDMTVVCFSTEESLMKWKFVTGYTVGQYKALTGETISNKIDFDNLHQFQLYIDSDLISFISGANIVVYPTSPIQFTVSGSKLLQLTFIKTREGVAYEVYVSVLGKDF